MRIKLIEALDAVKDQESFLHFVRILAKDRVNSANGREHPTFEKFLEAATAWAKDSNFGKSQGLADANHWKQFAAFLYAGTIYE